MGAGGASESSTVLGISISTIGSADHPSPRRGVGAIHEVERRRHDDPGAVVRRRGRRAAR